MNYRRQEVIGILLCVLALCVFLSFATYNPYETPSGLTPEVAQTNIMGLFGIYTSYYLMKFSFSGGTSISSDSVITSDSGVSALGVNSISFF